MKLDRKQILLDALKHFRTVFDVWLGTNPDRELLRIAHSQLSRIANKLKRAMKAK